jgi:hypothetical protein
MDRSSPMSRDAVPSRQAALCELEDAVTQGSAHPSLPPGTKRG